MNYLIYVSTSCDCGSWHGHDATWSLHFKENAGNPDAKEFMGYEIFAAMGYHVFDTCLVMGGNTHSKK